MRFGVAGVTAVLGGRGELRRMLWRVRGWVYGATWCELVVLRRRGVRGVLGDKPSLAAKVKICGMERSEPADWGGVKVNDVAESLVSLGS